MGSRAKKRKQKVKKKSTGTTTTNSSPKKVEDTASTVMVEGKDKETPKAVTASSETASTGNNQVANPKSNSTISSDAFTKLQEDVDALRSQIDKLPQKVKDNLGVLIDKLGELDFRFENVGQLIARYEPGTARVLEQENKILKERSTEYDAEEKQLRSTVTELKAQLQNYQDKESVWDSERKNHQQDKKALEQRRKDLGEQEFDVEHYQELKKDNENLKSIKKNNVDIDELRETVRAKEDRIDELETENNTLKIFEEEESRWKSKAKENPTLRAKIASLDDQLKIAKQIEESYTKSQEAYTDAVKEWGNKHTRIRETLEPAVEKKYLSQLKSTEKNLSEEKEQSQKKQRELHTLQAKYETLKVKTGDSVALRMEVDILREEQGNLQKRVNRYREDEKQLSSEYKSLQEKTDQKEKEFCQMEGTSQSLDEDVEHKKAEVEKLQDRIDGLTIKLEEIRNPTPEQRERLKVIQTIEEKSIGAEFAKEYGGKVIKDEIQWLNKICADIKANNFSYEERLIYAFHTSLKCSEWASLAVLSGFSGTGKSELPRLYSMAGGIRFLPVAVQPDWDSPQSLFGHFDYLSTTYKPTELLKAMDQSQRNPEDNSGFIDGMLLILLDEMNLARVELYFSDLLSKLETRRGSKVNSYINIDLGPGLAEYQLTLGKNILFAGTMNNDETTHAISDKVIDRSNVIEFPRPKELKDRIEATMPEQQMWLSHEIWETWKKLPKEDDKFKDEIKNAMNQCNDGLELINKTAGQRTFQSARQYIANYPTKEKSPDAWKIPFEDQIVQKIIPKLIGTDIETTNGNECLRKCIGALNTLGCNVLADDLQHSLNNSEDGIFEWKSSNYLSGG